MPNGMHLFDRSNGLNILCDEIKVDESRWSSAPRYMSIALTNACDLECAFCYAPKHPSRLQPGDIRRWACDLDNQGCLGIGFGGGEPTLFPNYSQLCRAISSDTNLAISMTTHGHLIDDRIASELSKSIHFIRVSMDGIFNIYESIRGRSFKTFLQKLQLIKKIAPFGINFVVNSTTITQLSEAAEIASENGASDLLLLPEVTTDGKIRLSVEESNLLSEWVNSRYKNYRISMSVMGSEQYKLPVLPISDPRGSTFDFMHIDASSLLKACAFDTRGLKLSPDLNIMDGIEILRKAETVHSIALNP